MSEHAKCWHCGSAPFERRNRAGKAIECYAGCGAQTPDFETNDEAWAWWDTRPIEDALRALILKAYIAGVERGSDKGQIYARDYEAAAEWLAEQGT